MVLRSRKESLFVRVATSKIHGLGVFAKKKIPQGTCIIEYDGERITRAQGEKRHKIQARTGAFYVFALDKKWAVDGATGGDARRINHGCDPNCKYEIKKGKIWILSIRNIKKGEELTYNYDVTEQGKYPCNCGARNCKGRM